jgi:hypothetical protein
MQTVIDRFPFVTNSRFIDAFEKYIEQAPSHIKPELKRCVQWLRELASK